MRCIILLFIVICAPVLAMKAPGYGETSAEIKDRGYLICGVSQGLAGFSSVDDKGQWRGIDVDYCHAVAAAVLGDADKIKFIPLSAKERFTALQSGEVDILSRNTTWTYLRDTTLGLNFAGIFYYDAQQMMVTKNKNIQTIKDLNNAIICTNAGTTTELNIADFFQANDLKYQLVTFEKTDETLAAYLAGRCDIYSTDGSSLAAQRQKLLDKEDHIILPYQISKEPLGPMVRQGDDQWNQIARWVLFALLNAEELGVNQTNVKDKLSSNDPNIKRLLGREGELGQKLNLKQDWGYQIISQVGNYDDIFEKNIGMQSNLKQNRGLNALYTQGGIHYAPPIR